MLPNMCLLNVNFPCTADIYYSIMEQDDYGIEQKSWIYDRTIQIAPQSVGDNSYDQNVSTGLYLKYDEGLKARVAEDICRASNGSLYPPTETVVVNVRDIDGNNVYLNYSGPRENQGAAFTVTNVAPAFDPFGHVEYYQLVLQRAQDQEFIGVVNDDVEI